MWRLSVLVLLACCTSENGEGSTEGQVWSTSCPPEPSLVAVLHPDGTFTEAHDGHGRWRISDNALHVVVLRHPSVQFMSMYPELISLDEDGVLPFIDPGTIEAEADGLKSQFDRCS